MNDDHTHTLSEQLTVATKMRVGGYESKYMVIVQHACVVYVLLALEELHL